MNDAEMYQISNQQQKRDAVDFLNEYSSLIKRKKANRVLDIGCGDGAVTNILKKYIPVDYDLLGCDISEKMVNHANHNYCNEQTSFMVLDIGGKLPERLKGRFDHVFSFYALHWIIDQECAYTNIYDLMADGGDCFTILVASHPVFDIYRVLARNHKWNSWFQDLDRFISPYHDMQDPDKTSRKMLETIGFTDIHVDCKNLTFIYENMEIARKALRSICPFKIPNNLYHDLMDDYVKAAKDLGNLYKINNKESLRMEYRLLTIHARKQA